MYHLSVFKATKIIYCMTLFKAAEPYGENLVRTIKDSLVANKKDCVSSEIVSSQTLTAL